jgi:hypothetical protein
LRVSNHIASLTIAVVFALPCLLRAQNPYYPGQSIAWQNAQSPFTPGEGAIVGGPGAGPEQGTPMYICRAMYQGSMTPGKWVKGNCNISYGGQEHVMRQYQVAYGNARWRRFNGNVNGLIQTGTEADGRPLYSCRVHYYSGSTGPSFPNAYPPDENIPNMPSPPDMNPPDMSPPSMNPPTVNPPSMPNVPNFPNLHLFNISLSSPMGISTADYGSDLGFQPGKIVNGNCNFPLGGREIVQPPPFQALYPGGGGYPPYYPPYPPPYPPYPPPPQTPIAPPLGPSSVTWQSEQAPFTPGAGAIIGGPGDGPTPGSPLYICRAGAAGGLYPGKWIQGQCSIAYGGREYKENTYDVAYGSATWGSFGGLTSDLIQGGYDSDQNPIFICRVPHFNFWFKDRGYQPGQLVNGQCVVSYGGPGVPSGPPFEALYSTAGAGAGYGPTQQQAPPPSQQQGGGIQVVFQSGTGATPGKITIMNGASGVTVTEDLAANLNQNGCVAALQKAAFDAGLQIQALPGGLKIFGTNNSVNVSGASVSVSQF